MATVFLEWPFITITTAVVLIIATPPSTKVKFQTCGIKAKKALQGPTLQPPPHLGTENARTSWSSDMPPGGSIEPCVPGSSKGWKAQAS